MKIAITGSNGQLGKELKRILREKTAEIGAIPEAYKDAEVVGADFDTVDFSDYESCFEFISREKPDIIINCAAFTNVDLCESELEKAEAGNIKIPENLAKASKKVDAKFIHISTDYVFDGNERNEPYTEDEPCAPETAYGRTKREGEERALANWKKTFVVRTAWLYGYEGNNFVKKIFSLAVKNGEVKVVADQVGNPTNANDLAYHLLKLGLTEKYGIYHCTGKGICSWFDFAGEIIKYGGAEAEISPCTSEQFKTPAKRPKYSALSCKKLDDVVGNEMREWKDAVYCFIDNKGLEG